MQAIVSSGAREGDSIAIARPKRGQWIVTRAEPPEDLAREAKRAEASALKTVDELNQRDRQAAAAAKTPPPQQRPGASQLAAAMLTAIVALLQAQDYAKSRGLELRFDAQDVRALAITMWIDARKEIR